MDYEKKYKEALEWARKVMQGKVGFVLDEVLEKFPELKESEDEKIRKSIINLVIKSEQNGGMALHKWESQQMLAWLEKQGAELSVYQNVLFKIATILSQHEDKEDSPLEQIRSIVVDGLVSAMDIDKQGEQKPEEIVNLHDYLYGEQKPVSIEMKTPEESLGIDSETYNKIIDECIYGNTEQKPAWNEEDERMFKNTIALIETLEDYNKAPGGFGDVKFWLKDLKERYTWKPSNEQMHYLHWIANVKLGDSMVEQEVSKHLNDLYNDLKKLKNKV